MLKFETLGFCELRMSLLEVIARIVIKSWFMFISVLSENHLCTYACYRYSLAQGKRYCACCPHLAV